MNAKLFIEAAETDRTSTIVKTRYHEWNAIATGMYESSTTAAHVTFSYNLLTYTY
jgi:hypothetical protein